MGVLEPLRANCMESNSQGYCSPIDTILIKYMLSNPYCGKHAREAQKENRMTKKYTRIDPVKISDDTYSTWVAHKRPSKHSGIRRSALRALKRGEAQLPSGGGGQRSGMDITHSARHQSSGQVMYTQNGYKSIESTCVQQRIL